MKKQIIAAAAALSLVATNAFAASNLTTSSGAPVGTTHNSTVSVDAPAGATPAYVVDAPAKAAPAKKTPKKVVKKKVAPKKVVKKVEAPKVETPANPIVEADPVIHTPAPTSPATQY